MGERTYAEERDRLREALDGLAEFADRRESPAVTDAARALDKKLVENRFNVVVFGEFKRGKTTFVDALLGADMLPSAVVPLTSIVTAVTWGREIRARIGYLDGREEDVDVTDLAAYVTERGNPDNALGVARAVVSYPSEDLRDGVFLVDTPGVGSVYQRNTEAARAFLSESDAAVFLTSADPPISETERAFLEEVRGEAARLFFVLNKIDYLSGLDREESIAFTQGVIEGAVGQGVVVYPMSARRALRAKLAGDDRELEASGVPAFERDFRAFLLDEKGRAILGLRGRACSAARGRRAQRAGGAGAGARSPRPGAGRGSSAHAGGIRAGSIAPTRHARSSRPGDRGARVASRAGPGTAAFRGGDPPDVCRRGTCCLAGGRPADRAGRRGIRVPEGGAPRPISAAGAGSRSRRSPPRSGTRRPASSRRRTGPSGRPSGCAARSSGSSSFPRAIPSNCLPGRGSVSASSNRRRSSSRSCRTFAGSCRGRPHGACSCATCGSGSRRWSTSTWDASIGTSCSGSTGVAVTFDRRLDRSLEATIESLGAGIERSERDRQRSAEDALRAKEDVRVDRRRLEQAP